MSDGGREIYSEGMGTTDGPGQGGLVDGQTAKGDRAEGRTGPVGVKAKRGYGFIYFIETENHEYIKIGFSTRPIMRLQDLSTNNPFRLRLLGFMPGSHATERYLHRRFKGDRTNGEWFRSSDAIRRMINGLGLLTEWADDTGREWQPPEDFAFIDFDEKPEPEEVEGKPRRRRVPRDPNAPKNPDAVTLARLRTQKTTPEQRSEISRKAGIAAGIANRERRYQ